MMVGTKSWTLSMCKANVNPRAECSLCRPNSRHGTSLFRDRSPPNSPRSPAPFAPPNRSTTSSNLLIVSLSVLIYQFHPPSPTPTPPPPPTPDPILLFLLLVPLPTNINTIHSLAFAKSTLGLPTNKPTTFNSHLQQTNIQTTMATTIPAGQTFIDTLKRSFVDVPIQKENDNAIPTTEFLEAAESLTTLFDILGSTAFKPVKSDMIGNINKLRERQTAAPAESQTIQDLVVNEIKIKKHNATEGLVWLVRGLDFTAQAISQNLSTPGDELSVSFRSAYADTLKPHHSFVIKPLFSAAMSACPYRKDFYEKLGDDQTKVDSALREWLSALENDISILKTFLDRKEAKW
ncbi:hypothetical protein ACMFMG_000426 [Clarireedia jacksonii]